MLIKIYYKKILIITYRVIKSLKIVAPLSV